MCGTACWGQQLLSPASRTFNAAWIHAGDHGLQLTLFPTTGPVATIPLPEGLLGSLTIGALSPDGNAIYVPSMDGVTKIELKPPRQSIVRGTAGIGTIWHLTASQRSGTMFVSGIVNTPRGTECGTFKIEPETETPRKLLTGTFPECGGGGGEVSPDGSQVMGYSGGDLCMIDLTSGAVQAVRGLKGLTRDDVTWKGQVAWSPDGQWIAATLDHRIILIDAKDPSKRKRLGSSGDGRVVWSGDSRHLLLLASQARCVLTFGYFESLETLDIETGKRNAIKNARCNISGGWIGWIDRDAAQ
jgi:WD40 repeat protein